jgi:alpha-L-arabinofuranosidase
MIFFDNTSYFLTPNYHIQKIFSTNQGDYYVSDVITRNGQDSLLGTSCVQDSRTGDIILKIVNAGNNEASVKIDLSRFGKLAPAALQTQVSGKADAMNSFEIPENVAPVISELKLSRKFECRVPAYSLTVIRIKPASSK